MLFSVHLKATMMKVIDPIIFGHVVRAFLPEVFERFGADPDAAGLSPNNGLGGILDGLADLPNGDEIRAAIEQGLADGPRLAMVNSDKGITNLHVPSDIIIDASMPVVVPPAVIVIGVAVAPVVALCHHWCGPPGAVKRMRCAPGASASS